MREPHAASAHGIVTISVGIVAGVQGAESDKADLLKAADDALYEAKGGGRNRVVLGKLAGK
jgi:diguanylate cyclase (GGDEF)-like protein